jgi:hypothetical protein
MSGALVHSRAGGWRVSDFYTASCERRSILEPTVGSVFRADPGATVVPRRQPISRQRRRAADEFGAISGYSKASSRITTGQRDIST